MTGQVWKVQLVDLAITPHGARSWLGLPSPQSFGFVDEATARRIVTGFLRFSPEAMALRARRSEHAFALPKPVRIELARTVLEAVEEALRCWDRKAYPAGLPLAELPTRREAVADEIFHGDDGLYLGTERYTRAPTNLERKVFGDTAPDRLLAVEAIRTGHVVDTERQPLPNRVWSVRNLGARSIRLLFRKIEKYLCRILGVAHTPPVFRVENERDTSRVDHSHESHRSRAPGRSRTSVDLVRWEPALT